MRKKIFYTLDLLHTNNLKEIVFLMILNNEKQRPESHQCTLFVVLIAPSTNQKLLYFNWHLKNSKRQFKVSRQIGANQNTSIFTGSKKKLCYGWSRKRLHKVGKPWRTLVGEDEQLDWPNIQTTIEFCHAWAALFLGVWHNHNSFCLSW